MKKVLITPLDWGLGHATRCIPIIHELLKRGCTVLIAGSGDSLLLLKNEFPHLTFFTLSAYSPLYSRSQSMIWKIVSQIPKFVEVIRKEHQQIQTLIEKHKIDFIISDNRYGCWSAKIPSVFMTHQLNILMPYGLKWIEPLVRRVNKRLIKKFSTCWIPDYAEETLSLSGKLSQHDVPRFITLLTLAPCRGSAALIISNRSMIWYVFFQGLSLNGICSKKKSGGNCEVQVSAILWSGEFIHQPILATNMERSF